MRPLATTCRSVGQGFILSKISSDNFPKPLGESGFSRKFDHVTPLLRQLNWLPVKQLLYCRNAVLTYKCFNGLAPKYVVDKFTKRSSIHARRPPKRGLLHIPLYRTTTGNAHLHIEELAFGTI